MRDDLSQVLADERETAAVLRRTGHTREAENAERILDRVAGAAEEWLLRLNESDASIRTGRSRAWLRARFPAWEREGHAWRVNGQRFYRAAILPRRADTVAAAQRGADAARALRPRPSRTAS